MNSDLDAGGADPRGANILIGGSVEIKHNLSSHS
jgi:hypothetical protein